MTAHFKQCIIYTYRLVGRLFDTENRNEKRKGSVSGAFYLIYLLSLSFARRIQTPTVPSVQGKSRSHGLLFSFFAKRGTSPLFYPVLPCSMCDYLLPPNFACTGVDHIIAQSLYKRLRIVHIEYKYFFLINFCCYPYIALSGTAHIKPTIVF